MKEFLSENIKVDKHINLFVLILVISSFFNDLFPQNIPAKPSRQSSFEAFSKGNYELAYGEFKELLVIYPKDPLYKYYSGVCLVKLNRNPSEAVVLLQQALQGAAVVKTLPSDALFYLGRAQQMSGKFTDAVNSFNLYTNQVGKKTSRELSVAEFIQQCNEKQGEVKEPIIKQTEIAENENSAVALKVDKPVAKEVPAKSVKDTLVKNSLPAGYEKILDEAIEFQIKADSLYSISDGQKKLLESLAASEKPALKVKISEIEILAASYQKAADQKYSEADAVMNPGNEEISPKETAQPAVNKVINDSALQTAGKTVNKSAQQPVNKVIKESVIQTDTPGKNLSEVKRSVDTYALFEVLPKPVTDPKVKIIIDPDVPAGLIYRIQIAVFRNPVAPSYFKGIIPVYGFKLTGTDKTNYYAGMFRRSSDASKALVKVKSKGFKDAFIVALSDKKTVSADRAAILEKEWGKKPFVSMTKSASETGVDTVPPTLSFRVEVVRSPKPVKEDVIEGIMKMAGNRGLDIQTLDDGNIAYLIGKFITFASATEYADLLIRNGYREARVVAWLGKREIPVETARQLFDNMQ